MLVATYQGRPAAVDALQAARVPDQHAALPYRFMLLLMPRFAASILLMEVGLNLSSCPKRLSGDTTFTEATKTFEKELTRGSTKDGNQATAERNSRGC